MRLIVLLWIALGGSAGAHAGSAEDSLKQANTFMTWLQSHEKKFLNCEIEKTETHYVLCDKTRVSIAELKKLFAMTPAELKDYLAKGSTKIEILCDDKKDAPFGAVCEKKSPRATFTKLTSLHGQYLPDEDVILLRGGATPGCLVHEYIHSLQSKNNELFEGHAYKKERNAIQKSLVQVMDDKIELIRWLEANGKKSKVKEHLPEFMAVNKKLREFAPWQDLIDERSIFLLYLKYGQEFGAGPEDIRLARKNMRFICKSARWKGKLPKDQCQL